jgi:hypothetical protein
LRVTEQVEAENLMALKFACEANAYESCVELIDELMVVRFSGKHPRRKRLWTVKLSFRRCLELEAEFAQTD